MVKIFLISHGPFSKGLLESIEMIAGPQEGITSLSLERGENPEEFRNRLQESLSENYDATNGVLVLCDLKGGTPYNSVAYLSQKFKMKLITGMNVPMVITLVTTRTAETSLDELATLATSSESTNIENVNLNFKQGGRKHGKLSINKN